MKHLSLALALLSPIGAAAVALAAPAAAQSMHLDAWGGGLGKSLRFDLAQPRGGLPFLLLSSAKRAKIPLSLFDPRDTRSLGLALDQPALWFVGSFDATGKGRLTLPVPNDPALAGRSLIHQALSLPGIGRLFDQVSNLRVTMFETSGAWKRSTTSFFRQARAFGVELDLGGGRHLLAGGGNGSLLGLTPTNTTEWFDELTRSFSYGPVMQNVRAVHTATRLNDGRWLLAGGVDMLNDPQTSAELFDPKSGKFVKTGSMSFKRTAHTATLLPDGRVLVTGGLSSMNNQLQALTSALKTTEIYDPKTGTWSRGPDMTIPRAGHDAVRLKDGRILISGGVTWKLIFIFKVPSITRTCEIYDPKTNRFTAVASMAKDRGLHRSVLLPNGKVLVTGGVGGPITSGGTVRSGCEIFDPATGKWAATGSLLVARGLHTLTATPDGRYVAAGGAQGTLLAPKAVAACEAYDPKTGTWTKLASLATGRAGHFGFAGGAGAVLVLGGGTGSSGQATNTWEILVP